MRPSPALAAATIDGARNMLTGCAGVAPGDRLLVVHEEDGQGFYDHACVAAVIETGQDLGARVERLELPFRPDIGAVPAPLRDAMNRADRTIFLARIGDQLRFGRALGGQATVCYALDAKMLGSAFGTLEHDGMVAVRDAVNAALNRAREIRVTCPAGTDFAGPGGTVVPADVGIRRFPMSVFAPVSAQAFSGRVALPGFLVGTGSQYYEPYGMTYDGSLHARFAQGRLTGFQGDSAAVRKAEAHYDHVAGLLGLDRNCVHSWHLGIHPGCAFTDPPAADFRRWSGGAFGNPRLLHFHTCGDYPPGEISWNVLDPTVKADGVALWRDGRLDLAALPGGAGIGARWPRLRAAFANPARAVGLEALSPPPAAPRR